LGPSVPLALFQRGGALEEVAQLLHRRLGEPAMTWTVLGIVGGSGLYDIPR
jgi:hypothetical protein